MQMPDKVKEKLVEIVCEAMEDGCIGHCNHPPCFQVERVVNALLEKGATVQEWISVKDRLPEIADSYIVVVKYKYDWEKDYTYDTDVATYSFDGGYIDDCWNTYNDWDEGQQYIHVTHWMPLPEPPKEV